MAKRDKLKQFVYGEQRFSRALEPEATINS